MLKMLLSSTRVGNIFRRQMHGNAEIIENCKEILNRNPRNLERLRIARKPLGYYLEQPGFIFWHKLIIKAFPRYVTAEIIHFENGTVISASSNEWGLKRQLYSTVDSAAYMSVGNILAQRCLESGISEVYVSKKLRDKPKNKLLLEEVRKGRIHLKEPKRYKHPDSWDAEREEKPWETFE